MCDKNKHTVIVWQPKGLSQPEAPEATVSELRRAATDDTQWGCSRPASPKLPWATFTVLRGFFLFTLHTDTELEHTHTKPQQ